jgi:signal transduction histidine kinase
MGTFKTKARAVELLGRKQIRDSVTALAELMKNSYDADADTLRVEFLTENVDNPCIVICDTGIGMDREALEDKWLVLGTPSKLENREKKTPGGRPLMGAKGIGRLAVSRLGQQMWMFTKKRETGWNILYINWNIFENPDLYIQDIEIPVLYEQSFEHLFEGVEYLRSVQKGNLRNKSWKTLKNMEKGGLIKKQIEGTQLDEELVCDFCDIIESSEKAQGTVIFALDLNDNWDRYLNRTAESGDDVLAERNYNRLNSFVSDFANNEKDFSVELFRNGELLTFTAGFNESDYELYDLKIEGFIEHGRFYGRVDARHGDPKILAQCNQVLEEGIRVTSGIKNWEEEDCGRYSVKLCHFEMDKKNTSLTAEEFESIRARLEKAGGVGVYRDNVRVLPYGEPDNDFLELEARRSKSATYYLFSHRNMFGRIDITSAGNPYLEDKSSREGFIENQYYNYFIKTLQNLLIQISVDFVGDMNKKSFMLRNSYLRYNNAENKKKEELRAFEKEQARLFQEDNKRVKELIKNNPAQLRSFERRVGEALAVFDKEYLISESMGYKDLLNSESGIKAIRHKIEAKITENERNLHIFINERFESKYDIRLLEQINRFNDELWDKTQKMNQDVCLGYERAAKIIHEEISRYCAEFQGRTGSSPEGMLSDLKDYLENTRLLSHRLTEEAQKIIFSKREKLEKKCGLIHDYRDELISANDSLEEERRGIFGESDRNLAKINADIMDFHIFDRAEGIQDIRGRIAQEEEKLYRSYDIFSRKTEEKFGFLDQRLDAVLERFEMKDSELIKQLITQNNELKQLNDMYADLANLGMAAEIVSHELSQLFNNVYDAVNQLRYQKIPSDGMYYLNQIDIGFRAISDRMSQMSPMYRSRALYRKSVNLYEMLEDTRRFFENRLKKDEVRFTNKVPKDLELKLSLSKIYPVISNLIYNSLYWVADKSHREILFHFCEEENALYAEDSGEGISVRNKERVFEPFFSLKKDGRGLGLAISRNVLEAQGHHIEVVTDSDNKWLNGACFKITFGAEEK